MVAFLKIAFDPTNTMFPQYTTKHGPEVLTIMKSVSFSYDVFFDPLCIVQCTLINLPNSFIHPLLKPAAKLN